MAVRENTHNGREPGGGGEAPGGGHGAAGARNARRLHAGLGGIGRPGERGRGARRPPPSQQAGERASERRGLGTLCHSSAEQKSMRGRHGGRLLASRTGGGRPRARATPVATETHLSLSFSAGRATQSAPAAPDLAPDAAIRLRGPNAHKHTQLQDAHARSPPLTDNQPVTDVEQKNDVEYRNFVIS